MIRRQIMTLPLETKKAISTMSNANNERIINANENTMKISNRYTHTSYSRSIMSSMIQKVYKQSSLRNQTSIMIRITPNADSRVIVITGTSSQLILQLTQQDE